MNGWIARFYDLNCKCAFLLRIRKISISRFVPMGMSVMRKTDLIAPGHLISDAGNALDFGKNLKQLRLDRNRSLNTAAALCSVSAATLSRIENGRLSPTFDVISKICDGFEIGIRDLLGYRQRKDMGGWSAFTKAGTGRRIETPQFRFELLCDDALAKPFLVFRAEVLCRTIEDYGPLQAHSGQEQIVVQSGRVEVWLEQFKPRRLEPGDSIAFDSRLGHAVLSIDPEHPATVLWVCDSQEAM